MNKGIVEILFLLFYPKYFHIKKFFLGTTMSNDSSVFEVKRLPFLLMTEAEKQSRRLAAIIEQPFETPEENKKQTKKETDLDLFYHIPHYLSLKGHEGAAASFAKYMKDNEKPHDQMVTAAINIATAHDYIKSADEKKEFPRIMYNYTIKHIQNGFRALQKVGEQHKHNYIGDMIDKARSIHHEYEKSKDPMTFLSEPSLMKDFKSTSKENLTTKNDYRGVKKPMMEGFIDDTAALDESLRSEYSANMVLGSTNKVGSDSHHIFVKTRGKRKSIAGPFRSEDEAKAHPAFKWGDGVCKGEMCENVSDSNAPLIESGVFKVSRSFYNKKAGRYMKRKIPVQNSDTEGE
jgi:hypothetical protein